MGRLRTTVLGPSGYGYLLPPWPLFILLLTPFQPQLTFLNHFKPLSASNLWIFCMAHPLICFRSLWHVILSEKCSLTVHSTNNGILIFLNQHTPLSCFLLYLLCIIWYICNECNIMHAIYIYGMNDYEQSNEMNPTLLYFLSEHWSAPDIIFVVSLPTGMKQPYQTATLRCSLLFFQCPTQCLAHSRCLAFVEQIHFWR